MANKIFWYDRKRIYYIRFISIDIYDLCAATPDSYAERLYEETKKFLEDHCISMKKVDYLIIFSKLIQDFLFRKFLNLNKIHLVSMSNIGLNIKWVLNI